MLNTVTATLDSFEPPPLDRSLTDRDEFGSIAAGLGLFAASPSPLQLDEREDLGHALCAWAPDDDLL
jgi:hypothetical protein